MAVTLGHILPGASAFSNSRVLTKPNDVVENSLLVAFLYNRTNATTITGVPSGWTLVASTVIENLNIWTYQKVAGASEPASYTWNYSAFSWHGGAMLRVDGADPAAPLGTPASAGMPDVASLDVGPVSTSADDGLFLLLQGIYDAGAGPSAATVSGFTLVFAVTGANYLNGYTKAQATAGSSGTVTISYGLANYDQVAAHLLPINPPASGPGAVTVGGELGIEVGFEGTVLPTIIVGGAFGIELGFEGAVTVVGPAVQVGGELGIEAGIAGQVLAGTLVGGALGIELGFEGAVLPGQAVGGAFGVELGIEGQIRGDVELAGGALGIEVGFEGTVLPASVVISGGALGVMLGIEGALQAGRLLGGALGIELGFRDRYTGPGSGVQTGDRPTAPLDKLRARQRDTNRMREGDWRPLMLPWVELDDVVGRGVVLARTASDDREEQRIEWQIIPESDPGVTATLRTGEALRFQPPERDNLAREVVRQRAERERVQRRR